MRYGGGFAIWFMLGCVIGILMDNFAAGVGIGIALALAMQYWGSRAARDKQE